MELDFTGLTQPGRRQPVFARHGAVATSQPLAAASGLRVLQDGGSAADACVAMAAALTVVEPSGNGLGSDAFALVWDAGRLHGLNGSGRSPAAWDAARLRAAGLTAVPTFGWASVTVPGAVRAWADLHARFGRLPFDRLLAPAIELAEEGHPVSGVVAGQWARAAEEAASRTAPEFSGWGPTFAPAGRAPRVGEVWRSPGHAATLRAIAATGGADFYEGDLAERTASFARQTGGLLTAGDLAAHRSEWVEPISTNYRGDDVWEIPPSGQGIAALIALNIAEGFEPSSPGDPDAWHRHIEATKLALADAERYVADPEHADVPAAELLAKPYADARRRLIGARALDPAPGAPRGSDRGSDTVYLCAVDGRGQHCSFIQSNYRGFGSGVVVPGTGISLQNRGCGFTLAPGHPNELAPGKRPFHTIIPGFLSRDGRPLGPFGVMGGSVQAQAHLQVVVDTVDAGDDPQTALGRPRWRWESGRRVLLEPTVDPAVAEGLRARGHDVAIADPLNFGRGQIIWSLADGVLVAGSEPRADAYPLGW